MSHENAQHFNIPDLDDAQSRVKTADQGATIPNHVLDASGIQAPYLPGQPELSPLALLGQQANQGLKFFRDRVALAREQQAITTTTASTTEAEKVPTPVDTTAVETPEQTTQPDVEPVRYITADEAVNVRKGTSTENGIWGRLEPGTSYRVLSEAEGQNGIWYQIEFTQNGALVEAWVYSGVVELVTPEPAGTSIPATPAGPELPSGPAVPEPTVEVPAGPELDLSQVEYPELFGRKQYTYSVEVSWQEQPVVINYWYNAAEDAAMGKRLFVPQESSTASMQRLTASFLESIGTSKIYGTHIDTDAVYQNTATPEDRENAPTIEIDFSKPLNIVLYTDADAVADRTYFAGDDFDGFNLDRAGNVLYFLTGAGTSSVNLDPEFAKPYSIQQVILPLGFLEYLSEINKDGQLSGPDIYERIEHRLSVGPNTRFAPWVYEQHASVIDIAAPLLLPTYVPAS